MSKITKKNQKLIKTLAVAYGAYSQASISKSPEDVIIWGKMILETQAELDFDAFPKNHIQRRIRYAEYQNESK